jgi:hypothetical protein
MVLTCTFAVHPASSGRGLMLSADICTARHLSQYERPLRSERWRWDDGPGARVPVTALRPGLQHVLDGLVAGPERAAPGAAASSGHRADGPARLVSPT